ncbi:MAG: winged helix-turn-helix domain-containing protein [Labilithrix sp.]|nr:winged helix-turn-helix domain-containing protein [Labilithrix sp.]MCW5813649.1 winged helix-turn-helix domain-containing protein [Labilithrix sp.]
MRRYPKPEAGHPWSLLTPHAHVLLCIAKDPDSRIWEIAESVGISERGAHQIVADLVAAGYVRRARIGRRNRYAIEEKSPLEHGPVHHRKIASIVALLGPEPPRAEKKAPPSRKRLSAAAKPKRRLAMAS